jgi:hypothetical protein
MYSNFKHFKASDSVDFYLICDTYDQYELDEFMSTRDKSIPIFDLGPTVYSQLPANYTIYRLPRWIYDDSRYYLNDKFDTDLSTRWSFNFMINRATTSRYIFLKILEDFPIANVVYTYTFSRAKSFERNRSFQVYDYTSEIERVPLYGNILNNPIGIPAQTYIDETKTCVTEYGLVGTKDISPSYNHENYHQFLKSMFESSAISLITESTVTTKQCMSHSIHFSEKTLFSILGLTFPIWSTGYGAADVWKSYGFDVFDDIIDHSYQYKETLGERIWYSLELNRSLLKDPVEAGRVRESCKDRLIANRDLLQSNHLRKCLDNAIANVPEKYQPYLKNVPMWFDTFDSKQ